MEYIVKEIKKNKKGYKVRFNDDSFFQMSEDIFTDYYFYIDKVFTREEYQEIEENINASKAYSYAINLLTTRAYSKKDVFNKLVNVKKCDKDIAEKIINRLIKNHYIDDKSYANELIYDLSLKSYGYDRIVYILKEKGISDNEYDFHYDEDYELKKAKSHLDSLVKKYDNMSSKKKIDSIFNAYLRLGFKKDVINLVLSSINQYDLLGEIDNLKKDYLKITFKMDSENILNNKQKIIDRLLRKGYRYSDIKKVMEEE